MAKKNTIKDLGPYPLHDHIHVSYELQWKRDVIKPGTPIQFKGVRGIFNFRCMAHNTQIDKTWIDCIGTVDQQFHSFHIDKLKGIVKPKRSRRHKPQT